MRCARAHTSAMDTVLVTGGAGFIGSAVVRKLISSDRYHVCNVDKLTYAGNLDSLAEVVDHDNYSFQKADITHADVMRRIFDDYDPIAVIHLAAESHVDRSIDAPAAFVDTNVVGTFTLLNEALRHFERRPDFKFVHVSTDEVFGSLGGEGKFTPETSYDPSSPYSATKAASDHLVRAWHRTYGVPVVVTNCSNNYGPYQFPEKLIPLTILKGIHNEQMPVYGNGENVRDWLYVDDHADALITVMEQGRVGETYLVGGNSERRNIDVVLKICAILDELRPSAGKYEQLINFVQDRPGHDHRYAIDASKITRELGWQPKESFESGLRKTVEWYLENETWWRRVQSGEYKGGRLGLRVV